MKYLVISHSNFMGYIWYVFSDRIQRLLLGNASETRSVMYHFLYFNSLE